MGCYRKWHSHTHQHLLSRHDRPGGGGGEGVGKVSFFQIGVSRDHSLIIIYLRPHPHYVKDHRVLFVMLSMRSSKFGLKTKTPLVIMFSAASRLTMHMYVR